MTVALHYSKTEQDTWARFHAAISKSWQEHQDWLHPYYLENVDVLRPFSQSIPTLTEINRLLQPIGFKAQFVSGYVPSWKIARYLAKKVFPISRSFRGPDEVFFAREPDFIHDVFGHLPSLFNQDYRKLLATWAQEAERQPVTQVDRAYYHINKTIVQANNKVSEAMMSHLKQATKELDDYTLESPSRILTFDKLYFWIFEFGIIGSAESAYKVLGAGLLSSLSELQKLAQGAQPIGQLTLDNILSPYNISAYQSSYLASQEVEQFYSLIQGATEKFPGRRWAQRQRVAR